MYPSELYLLPVELSLAISLMWFIYNLKIHKFIPPINDRHGVLLPSIFLIVSPFLFTNLFIHFDQQVIEAFKIILPILTFALGQSISKFEKNQENKSKLKKAMRALVQSMGVELTGGLSELEHRLTQHAFQKISYDEIEKYRRELLEKIEKEYQRLINKEELLENDTSMVSTLYIRKVQDFLNNFSLNDDASTFDSAVTDIAHLKLEGYSYISNLIKDFLIADKLLVSSWIYLLKNERKILKKRISRISQQLEENISFFGGNSASSPTINTLKKLEKNIDGLIQTLLIS